jgi:histidinol-phosphate aminotransferase
MTKWFAKKLTEISKFDNYMIPEKAVDGLKLDANENLVLDKKFIYHLALQALKDIDFRQYPIKEFEELYLQLAKYTKMDKKYLAIGNGSDQIIELILSIIGKNQRATVFTPTFSYFINRCQLHGMLVDEVPLKTYDNVRYNKEFLKSARRSGLVYICSPNNPMGSQFERKLLLEMINTLQDKLVLIDEAYVEFADYSLISDVLNYDNVILLRTLSKAFGLAGARVGYLISNSRIADLFRSSIQSPYPLSIMSVKIASLMLSHFDYVNETVQLIKYERNRIIDRLARIKDIRVFKSQANFIFIEGYDNYRKILKELKKERISVRALGNIDGYKGCIRVTIGTYEMNKKFLKSIENVFY